MLHQIQSQLQHSLLTLQRVGDNTGKVIIAGDLQVDGTTTTVNSTTVNIVDKNIQVATGSGMTLMQMVVVSQSHRSW